MYSTNGLTNISNYTTTGLGSSVGTITIAGQTIYLSASPNIGGNITLTLNIPNASSSVTGLLTSTDWNTFNGKENVLTFSSPLSRIANTVSIPQANATTNGYLSSTDWNTFNAGSVDILPLNNSWSGTNTFNNDVTINCNGSGLTGSPKLILSLPNFKTEVNDINNLYRIVQTGANKAFYLSRLNNQIYSHYPLNVNDNDYTFTLSTTEYLDGCYVYSGVFLTADRTIFLPINTQFATVYGTNYTCSFTILTSTSALNNKRWKIDKTGTSVNTTMYVNQVLQTSYPFFLSLNTPYICEVESFLSGSSQILVYNFRSLEKTQVIPNLQQVLNSGNQATSTNIDLSGGILLASQVDTNVLASNTITTIDVLNDLYLFPTIALKYYGEVSIKRLATNIITTTSSGTILNLLPSKVALNTIPNTTKPNLLYYDTTSKEVSYGSLVASSPIDFSGNTISIPKANATTNGYLSSTDWNTFNSGSNILPLNNTFTGTNTFSNSDFKLSGIPSNTTVYSLYYNFSTKAITYGIAPAGANLLNSDNTWTLPNNFTNAQFKVSLQSDAGDEMVVINNTTKQLYRTAKPNVNSLLSTINNWTAANTFDGNLTVNSPFITTINGQLKYAAPSASATANCLYWDASTNLITRAAIPNVNSLLTTTNTFTQNNTFSGNLTVGLVSTFSGSIVASNLLNAAGDKSVFWDSTSKQFSQQESYLTRANIFAGNNRFNGTTYFNNATNTFANMPLTTNTTYIVCRNISTGNLEYGIKGTAVPFSLAKPLYLDTITGLINLGIDANLMMVDASNNLTIKKSSTIQDGYLSAIDYTTFNNKENVLSFSYPLSRTGNTITTPNLKISSVSNSNTFIGYNVGNLTNSGSFNTFIGSGSGFNLTSGTTNIGIGGNTLTALTSGGSSIAIGNSALRDLTTGSDNCAIGGLAEGQSITTGSQNTLINCQNITLTTGVKNIIIGRGNSSPSTNLQSFTLIGSNNSYDVCDYSFLSGYGNRIKGFYNVIIGANNQSTQSGGVYPSLLYNNTIGYNNLTNHTDCNVFGSNMTTQANNSTYVNNIRNLTNTMMLSYNTTTKEITYETKPSIPDLLISNNTWTGTNTFNGLLTMNNGYTMNTGSAVFNSGQMFFNSLPNTVGDRILSHQLSSGEVRSITPAQFYASYPPSAPAGISLKSTNTVVGIGGSGGTLVDSYNTIVGAGSALNILGGQNTVIGSQAAYSLTTGTYNVSVGHGSNFTLNSGYMNIGIGYLTNYLVRGGGYNIGIGTQANYANNGNDGNVAIGYNTNNHNFSNCLHFTASNSNVLQCNGSGQWMGPQPWQYNTGSYYLSTGFGPTSNLIGYYYSSYLSDARTKSNIVDANTSYYLDLVNQMRVRNFKYNDGKSNMNVGLITQEMETNDNLKFLIDENEGYTFDINDFFKFDNIIRITSKTIKKVNEETKVNEDTIEEKEVNCLKIYIDTAKHVLVKGDYIRYARDRDTKDVDFIEMEAEILECYDDYIVIENLDHIGIKDIGHNDSDLTTIFIEGKWVKDIKLIKKDAMAFVLLPAVQQLTKENEDLKARVAKLEATLEKVLLRIPSYPVAEL